MFLNIEKLKLRYPEQFTETEEDSLSRNIHALEKYQREESDTLLV